MVLTTGRITPGRTWGAGRMTVRPRGRRGVIVSTIAPLAVGALLAVATLGGAGFLSSLFPAANEEPILIARLDGDVITPGSEVTYRVGDLVHLDLTSSFDADGRIVFWGVDFGDGHLQGGEKIGEAAKIHAYASPGAYELFAGVKDSAGAAAVLEPRVRIRVVDPALLEGGRDFASRIQPVLRADAERVNVGDPVTFDAGNVDPRRVHAIRWDFGDGTSRSAPVTTQATHSYARAGSFVVKVSVETRDGRIGIDRLGVEVGYRGERVEPPALVGATVDLRILTGRACFGSAAPGVPGVCAEPLLFDPGTARGAADSRIMPGASQARFLVQMLDADGAPVGSPSAFVRIAGIDWTTSAPPRAEYPVLLDAADLAYDAELQAFVSPVYGVADDAAILRSVTASVRVELDGRLHERGYESDGYLVVDRWDLEGTVHYTS